jgi:SAM-dependent methyltransferase
MGFLVTGSDDAHVLRTTFDRLAEQYDDARPVAPAEVFDDLVALASLAPGARLLEIGCGTGQATLPLAERGFEIVAVEIGERLAELARRKLAPFPGVEIVTSSFEEWDPGDAHFKAVVSFNAFHWIDPDVRFAKPAAVLVAGGSLAVVGSHLIVHDGVDPVWLALAEDYETVTGKPETRLHVDEARDRSAEFTDGGHFGAVTRKTYMWDTTYTADEYVALRGTMSMYAELDDCIRDELFERIRLSIEAAGGVVTPTWFAVLYVAERA